MKLDLAKAHYKKFEGRPYGAFENDGQTVLLKGMSLEEIEQMVRGRKKEKE